MATFLNASQILEHPEYPYVIWDLTATSKGKVAVAKDRDGPINIAYEIHGHGPKHIVWIMGLGAFKEAWQRQTQDFGHDRASEYTCLIFDNRGTGDSEKPIKRYSTSEMAKDVVDLVDCLGWTARRQLHVVGVSMGGMISQEFALQIPDRIASLSLISSAARLTNTVSYFEHLTSRINLLMPKSLDARLANARSSIFSPLYPSAPDELATVHCISGVPFPTNGDRFAAQEVSKRQTKGKFTLSGFLCQAIAAGWHHKSDEELRQLADQVGRSRILVVHGEMDRMVTFPHGEMLRDGLGKDADGEGVKWIQRVGQGHVVLIEEREEFGKWIREIVAKTEDLNREEAGL